MFTTQFTTQYSVKPARAQTTVALANGRILQIVTRKSPGYLLTNAQGAIREGNSVVCLLFTDFYKELTRSLWKCTDDNVRRQHQAALAAIDSLLVVVNQFYAELDAKTAISKQSVQLTAVAAEA